MNRFVQLHLLTFYPPSNLNRDDSGKPKTAIVGGATRLRISSQALKRAWRTSDIAEKILAGHLGKRTQRIGVLVLDHLRGKADDAKALEIAREIAAAFGKVKSEESAVLTEQLAFVSPEEQQAAIAYAEARLSGTQAAQEKKALAEALLRKTDTAADIAMFGRMLADSPEFNREAAVQVAHAITTHAIAVDDDYYTAVDDLKTSAEDAGAGFIGETGFGAGVFYLYANIDRALLRDNLGDDSSVARKAIEALVTAAATVGPRGKSASFASFARAAYILAERGSAAPRTLAGAFLQPVDRLGRNSDQLATSINCLRETRARLMTAYGDEGVASTEMNTLDGTGALADIIAFATEGL
ncbi:type I-E CRISPR-associated protein Cas7/Cse4/CasC [Methylocystis echinoides]|uniref:Type I-E CRISPR-associated protein Cas7/Cse4/CasC n=1 Tax=Methylocystis echinoides TaxID=29468 RepID=A0A9W6LSC2_9HYPH|nr:type I-E CRISPR-associated protein Cas7/Cse4/CasC [Methylocystis echinoides]GLI93428.1 type I-E CRISPR-associated protein Cas7/Cse4/CasC [Methylocystis echinoides]